MLENLRVLGGGSARAHLPRFFFAPNVSVHAEMGTNVGERERTRGGVPEFVPKIGQNVNKRVRDDLSSRFDVVRLY